MEIRRLEVLWAQMYRHHSQVAPQYPRYMSHSAPGMGVHHYQNLEQRSTQCRLLHTAWRQLVCNTSSGDSDGTCCRPNSCSCTGSSTTGKVLTCDARIDTGAVYTSLENAHVGITTDITRYSVGYDESVTLAFWWRAP